MAHESIRDVLEEVGYQGEVAVAGLIRDRGHDVRHDGNNALHDLVVDGEHQPMREDVLVLRCLSGSPAQTNGDGQTYHFVIPGCVLPERLTKIDITSHPTRYGGRYSPFLEAWDLLDAVAALREREGRQIPLPGLDEIPF